MTPSSPFDPSKHPRGYAGRFSAGPGRSSAAHAFRGKVRPRPPEAKRLHAVSPTVATRPRGISLQTPMLQSGD